MRGLKNYNESLSSFLSLTLLATIHKNQLYLLELCVTRVGGVTVSMVAFQAADPGSTPGQRTLFFIFLLYSFIFLYIKKKVKSIVLEVHYSNLEDCFDIEQYVEVFAIVVSIVVKPSKQFQLFFPKLHNLVQDYKVMLSS